MIITVNTIDVYIGMYSVSNADLSKSRPKTKIRLSVTFDSDVRNLQ